MPADLDPVLLGFFIPVAELPPDPAADPVVQGLLQYLALVYSVHNTAIGLLDSGAAPASLAVHYALPPLPAELARRRPRLREAAWRLLDLLLGDLLQHAAGARLTLAGLAGGDSFMVGENLQPSPALTDVAPALLREFSVTTDQAPLAVALAPLDEPALLRRNVALDRAPAAMLAGPPGPGAVGRARWMRGQLLLAEQRPGEALPLLAPAWFENPEDTVAALALYECLHQTGLRAEAAEPGATLFDHEGAGPFARLVEAELMLRYRGLPEAAAQRLAGLRDDPVHGALALALYCEALLVLKRFAEARGLFEAAIADGSAVTDSYVGLALASYHLGDLVSAEAAARTAVERGTLRLLPSRILEHIAARRARQPVRAELPGWNELIDAATRRDDRRAAYATQRAEFLAVRAAGRTAPARVFTGAPALPREAAWTIVTGLPRAGLALLMRMLAFGGHPVLTDGVRRPDAHNLCGYFEWEPASRLAAEPRVIDDAADHALKLPVAALAHLPRDRRYRVLFVTRDADEIARSQAAVLGREAPASVAAQLARRATECLAALRADATFDVLEVPYAGLRGRPAEWAGRLAEFLGHDRLPRPAAMARAIHPDLPRHSHP